MMHLERSADSDTEIENVLEALTPQLLRARNLGWMFVFFAVVIAVPAQHWSWNMFADGRLETLPTLALVISIGGINTWVSRKQQRLVMPFLARSAGFKYQQDARAFLNKLPPRLLPKAWVRSAEDLITGNVANRPMSLAEVTLKTGNKNSKTLFDGFVIRFENVVSMPAFFVAREKHANPGPFTSLRIEVWDLIRVDTFTRKNGDEYGVWMSKSGANERQPPALRAVINALGEMEQSVAHQAKLFSATSNGIEMHVALSNKRNLFHFGGLVATKAKVLRGIQSAAVDFNIPISLVGTLIEAERQALVFSEDKKAESEAH